MSTRCCFVIRQQQTVRREAKVVVDRHHVAAGRCRRVVGGKDEAATTRKIERSSAAVLRFSRRGEEIVDDTARRLTGLPYCLYVAMPRPPVVFDDGALSISIDGGKISVDGPRDGSAQ